MHIQKRRRCDISVEKDDSQQQKAHPESAINISLLWSCLKIMIVVQLTNRLKNRGIYGDMIVNSNNHFLLEL